MIRNLSPAGPSSRQLIFLMEGSAKRRVIPRPRQSLLVGRSEALVNEEHRVL